MKQIIPLPDYAKSSNALAHPYPFKISIQTQEFLQASLFHTMFMDAATGEYVRQPGGLKNIEKLFLEKLHTQKTYDQAWGYIHKYQSVFLSTVFQSVLIALNSHWDWYVRKLGTFIDFADSANLEKKHLLRINCLPLKEQLEIIERACGIKLKLTQNQKYELEEMTLVRNLGLHNRWEIDSKYMSKTRRMNYCLNEIRVVKNDELLQWHAILIELLSDSAEQIAIKYVNALDFA